MKWSAFFAFFVLSLLAAIVHGDVIGNTHLVHQEQMAWNRGYFHRGPAHICRKPSWSQDCCTSVPMWKDRIWDSYCAKRRSCGHTAHPIGWGCRLAVSAGSRCRAGGLGLAKKLLSACSLERGCQATSDCAFKDVCEDGWDQGSGDGDGEETIQSNGESEPRSAIPTAPKPDTDELTA